MKIQKLLFPFILAVVLCSCESKYYTMDDFAKVEKIDGHYHIYTDKNNSLEQARKDNFKLFEINVYLGDCEEIFQVHHFMKQLAAENPDEVAFSTAFCLDGWDDPAWVDNTIAWIDQCVADGANSVKVWKNIGMEFRDKDSVLIMIDDPKFDPIFKHLAENNIPLIGHLGEPKNCWLPFDEMTTKNDSSYFARHPEYHMYQHPEFPSYEEQIAARDRMLEKNPDLTFIGCHFASIEWSVDELAKFFDRFPNAAVDMAARMGHTFYQSKDDREKVRNFFIKYQDRIIYGTDNSDHGTDKEAMQKSLHEKWLRDWEYLTTDNEMQSTLINGSFKGLKLPKEVVNKTYSENYKKWYKSL